MANVTTVPSYAGIVALTPSAGDVVYMEGYNTAGDDGGGLFYWDYASTTIS